MKKKDTVNIDPAIINENMNLDALLGQETPTFYHIKSVGSGAKSISALRLFLY